MKKLVTIILLFSQLISIALGCSCIGTVSVKDEFKRVNAVFLGKVIQVTTKNLEKEVIFYVFNAWKGIWSRWVRVKTCENSACCGIDFQKGYTYLVYAQNVSGKLNANLCSRTTDLANALEDIKKLNEILKRPTHGKSGGIVDQTGKN
jgi:hypothetical protein